MKINAVFFAILRNHSGHLASVNEEKRHPDPNLRALPHTVYWWNGFFSIKLPVLPNIA